MGFLRRASRARDELGAVHDPLPVLPDDRHPVHVAAELPQAAEVLPRDDEARRRGERRDERDDQRVVPVRLQQPLHDAEDLEPHERVEDLVGELPRDARHGHVDEVDAVPLGALGVGGLREALGRGEAEGTGDGERVRGGVGDEPGVAVHEPEVAGVRGVRGGKEEGT